VLLEKLAVAWEEAEAFAAKYVDTFRGLSAGCFHSCLLQLDGQLILLGDDGANQCMMPEGLSPQVSVIEATDLPLGILTNAKPKLLEAPEPDDPSLPPAPPAS